MKFSKTLLLACGIAAVSAGCSGVDTRNMSPIEPVAQVDLHRFMGSWYVIGSIPSFLERKAYNAVETYKLQPDGHIATSFRYRKSAFDNPVKTIHSTGFVQPDTHDAIWGVQIIWPIKAQYKIAYLNDDYSETIISRDKRDYVWIMARTPTIPQADYDALLQRVKAMGYDMKDMRKVPQQWPEKTP